MKVDSSYPDAWPFTESDFPAGSEFLNVDGAPMALLPGPTLVNFFSGKARIVPTSALKVDNNSEMPFEAWSAFVERCAASYTPAWGASGVTKPPATPNLYLDHPLNKLALAMLKRWSRREMPDLMPVLELALIAVPEGDEDGPEGQAFEKARRLTPATVLALLEEAFQPEDLLDATDLQDAAQMILSEIESFGEITDSQLYRERDGRDE